MNLTPPDVVAFIKEQYKGADHISLHEPVFDDRELELVSSSIRSTFVSSVGEFVDGFERALASYVGAPCVVVTSSGTSALHVSLHALGVSYGDVVVTQPLTFVATCNAIRQAGAEPAFVDIDSETLGMSPDSLSKFLETKAELQGSQCVLKENGQPIKVVLPMHTLGHPVDLHGLGEVCAAWHLDLVEDAAEALGSQFHGRHVGNVGRLSALSFNGNKIITTGGGGAVICSDIELGARIKHLTTTAKVNHSHDYVHDELGFNYRLPNLNAALGCAQLEKIETFLSQKRGRAREYKSFFAGSEYQFVEEPRGAVSNYWLNAVLCAGAKQRDELMTRAAELGVYLRPAWELMHRLPMYRSCARGDLTISEQIREKLVCLPSGCVLD